FESSTSMTFIVLLRSSESAGAVPGLWNPRYSGRRVADHLHLQTLLDRDLDVELAAVAGAGDADRHHVLAAVDLVRLPDDNAWAADGHLLALELRFGAAGDHVHQLADGVGEVLVRVGEVGAGEQADDAFGGGGGEAQDDRAFHVARHADDARHVVARLVALPQRGLADLHR